MQLVLIAADQVEASNGSTPPSPLWGGDGVLWLGVIASVIGIIVWLVICATIWRRDRFLKLLPSIIAHVHHRKVHAGHHIIAALFFFSGASLIGGFIWARLFDNNPSDASYIMTNAGMALGVLTLLLTVWTLNQTMKLERLHGDGIERFDELIREITEHVDDLVKRYDDNRDKSSGLYRFILVTNNPYFGIISYKGRPVTQRFETAIHSLVSRIEAENETQPGRGRSGLRLKVICADEVRLREFVYSYSSQGGYDARLEEATKKSEEFIHELMKRAGNDSVIRISIPVSEAQFAVVGDVVFEFFLDPQHSTDPRWKRRGSNIRATNKIHDRGAADRFERFALFLEELIQHGKVSGPKYVLDGFPQTSDPNTATPLTPIVEPADCSAHNPGAAIGSVDNQDSG